MNSDIKRLSRSVSVLAVMGWMADTCASVALHRGWWTILPMFNTVMTLGLVIALYQATKRA